MEQDPILERREHEAAEAKARKAKSIMIVFLVATVALAAVLAYVWKQNSALISDLEAEKEDLTAQMVALQQDYQSLSSDYESINAQLDTSRAEVALLIERIKKTEATNRSKIRQYEKELGTLRSIMKSYIVQIDSLNTLNHKLAADAAAARREAAESRRAAEELTRQVSDLSDQVAAGAVIKARAVRLEGFTAADRKTERSSRTRKFMTSLSLVENDLAAHGPLTVYIRVKDPSGIIITNASSTSFEFEGEMLAASASREVDYEGKEVDMSIYLNDLPSCVKGTYSVEVYTEAALLGKAELYLR